jgi:ubiquitin carboxyl-terminal hydrolase 5/13
LSVTREPVSTPGKSASIGSKDGILTFPRHYVAFIRKKLGDETSWVLFNDEKVVKVVDVEEMKKFAYVYFFKRV